MEGADITTDLGTGTIRASFYDSGKDPVVMDRSNSLVRLGTTASTVPLNIFAEMPSGPVDLEGSSPITRSWTSASVQRSSGGQPKVGRDDGVAASGDLVLKQLKKKLFRADAFSQLSVISTPLESNVGIEHSSLFNSLIDFQKSLEF